MRCGIYVRVSTDKTKDIKDIEKAIEKLKMQEKKLVNLYLSSTLNVETINNKNDVIKKEIENLNKKKQWIDPNNDYKEYTIELLKKVKLWYWKWWNNIQEQIKFWIYFLQFKQKIKERTY